MKSKNPFMQAYKDAIERGEDEKSALTIAKVRYADLVSWLNDERYHGRYDDFVAQSLYKYTYQLNEVLEYAKQP